MTDNRYAISDREILLDEEVVQRGCIGWIFSGGLVVEEGTCGVVTVGGKYHETLEPGTHSLARYPHFRDIKCRRVETRSKTMRVETEGEFFIREPVHAPIKLALTVKYQVVDPYTVAYRVASPLGELFERAKNAARETVKTMEFTVFLVGGDVIGADVLRRLSESQLEEEIGLKVQGVIEVVPQPMDETSKQLRRDLEALHESDVHGIPSFIGKYGPQAFLRILDQSHELRMRLIDMAGDGTDIRQFLGQSQTSGQFFQQVFEILGAGPFLGTDAGETRRSAPQLTSTASSKADQRPADRTERLREEYRLLAAEVEQIEYNAGKDAEGFADGTHLFRLEVPLGTEQADALTVFIECPVDFPQEAPAVNVKTGEQIEEAFPIAWWSADKRLVDVVRKMQQFYQ